ncbi:ring canal kelch homolog isoform X2 [Aphis gossypii]|uniref:ring canal kelch homolog isoform X2 n=1 Tax=Aphis gossypii TaxID=80765 RepID=UPI0021590DDC|nr:ring canal kelch homolog isoform X2 [Aphis gossypii]
MHYGTLKLLNITWENISKIFYHNVDDKPTAEKNNIVCDLKKITCYLQLKICLKKVFIIFLFFVFFLIKLFGAPSPVGVQHSLNIVQMWDMSMSMEEMDSIQQLKSNQCKSINYKNSSHKDRVFEVLQSFRNENDIFCDIMLQTDDGIIVYGHKYILASATPYFKAMFSSFSESNKDRVNITKVDSTILKLLIDYIYTGEIMITHENVQFVLVAADLLQLDYVKQACVEFLQKQLDPSNCLGIKVFADLHNCIELWSNCEAFIKNQFLEVVKCDEFLSLSSEEVIKLISCNDVNVPFEEKVYECVIKWVKHELNQRIHLLPNLMEHVRLPLISKEYLVENVVNEPLLKNDPKCKEYVFEALHFQVIKSVKPFSIPETIWSKPRQLSKIVLVLSWSKSEKKFTTNWYDPATNQLQLGPEITNCNQYPTEFVVKDKFVFVMYRGFKIFDMFDTSLKSPCLVRKPDLLVSRSSFRACVLNDCIYSIGSDTKNYSDSHKDFLNTVDVFNLNTQKWQIVSEKISKRKNISFGVGVLNNFIYTVGGFNGSTYLKSVECYDPSLDKWYPVAEMSIERCNVGVGVLNGIMYVVGGANKLGIHKCVEAFSPYNGVWTSITDMNLCRENPVVALDGLLYVIGGNTNSNSIEIYNPKIKSWSMKTISISGQMFRTVVVNRPPHLIIN